MNNCTCGHAEEEHKTRKTGPVECEVEDCDCIQYEWDGEEE